MVMPTYTHPAPGQTQYQFQAQQDAQRAHVAQTQLALAQPQIPGAGYGVQYPAQHPAQHIVVRKRIEDEFSDSDDFIS